MSWQAYVDTNLIGSGKVSKASILGLDGSVWATSSGFTIAPAEAKELIAAFKDPSSVRANGLKLATTKYVVLRADDRSVYAKSGSTGVACVKTKQAVLVAYYDDKIQPGEATKVVEQLADYLISVGY